MVKAKKEKSLEKSAYAATIWRIFKNFTIGAFLAFVISVSVFYYLFENKYKNKVYPGVKIEGIDFGGRTKEEVKKYFDSLSQPFENIELRLTYDTSTATISGLQLKASYDSELASKQAIMVGRSGYYLSDLYQKIKASTEGITLTSLLKYDTEAVTETLNNLALAIDVPSENALFSFQNGKVTAFKPAKTGMTLNKARAKSNIENEINKLIRKNYPSSFLVTVALPVDEVMPSIPTDSSNSFGIRELLGRGTSKFVGSIAGRVHNIELAASRIHGHLIPPGSVFSFNEALGDVSASTGFAPAYVIMGGRTVLGDGGGVCQVSTTLFRAAMSAGLPIIERKPHSYRVTYYEQDSGPGIDATVYSPTEDLKIKNDTPSYALIQSSFDPANMTLAFEIFGTSDGRRSEISKPVIHSQIPPPPDVYQDDPTLPQGTVKQVDWRAWGAKVSFKYKVTRGDETLIEDTFVSNYQPWRAVFLKGTKQ